MIDKNTQEKIEFSGIIRSVQPRSNVWRYRLDNRTHSMTGYNLFLSGETEGTAKDFSGLTKRPGNHGSEKCQSFPSMTGGDVACWTAAPGKGNASHVNGPAWQM